MITTIITHVIAAIAGAVFSYLFLRANPNKKAVLDSATAQARAEVDSLIKKT